MEASNSTSTLTIHHADVAELLLNAQTQRLIHPFLGKEQSAGGAAKILGMSTSALLYRVNKLLEYGILKVVREEPRAGRASKVYTTTASSFFVPFRVTRAETLEAHLAGVKHYYEQLLTANVAEAMRGLDEDWGMRVFQDDEGRIQTLTAVYPDKLLQIDQVGPALLDFFYPSLHLDHEDAKALQHELVMLIQKYAVKRGAQRYLSHVGLVPLVREKL